MTLHEVLTIYLYGGCYLVQLWEIGAIISLLHGVSDILIMVSKVLSESVLSNWAAVTFVVEMFIWFYTRLIVFPWIIWVYVNDELDYYDYWLLKPFFAFGLSCLVLMHAYWFSMFVKIMIHFVTKGEADDKIEEDVEKNVKEIEATDPAQP